MSMSNVAYEALERKIFRSEIYHARAMSLDFERQMRRGIFEPSNRASLQRLRARSVKLACLAINGAPEEYLDLKAPSSRGTILSFSKFESKIAKGEIDNLSGVGFLMYKGRQTNLEIQPHHLKFKPDLSRFEGVAWFE